jgi:tRNA U55 pseudouridine synthase TruB
VFSVDKPFGKTSASVVGVLKAILSKAIQADEGASSRIHIKVGHGGTLVRIHALE